eukprot:6490565-Amphidinium_carterae.2
MTPGLCALALSEFFLRVYHCSCARTGCAWHISIALRLPERGAVFLYLRECSDRRSVFCVSALVPLHTSSSNCSEVPVLEVCSTSTCLVHECRSCSASRALLAMSGAAKTPAKRGRSAVDKAHEADGSTSKAIRVRYDKSVESQVSTALRGRQCKHLLPIQIDGVRDSTGAFEYFEPSPFGCYR